MSDSLNKRLEGKSGQKYWRGLEELLDTPEFREMAQGEFAPGADEPPDQVSRRTFMKLMGASMALAGMTACGRSPEEQILPYTIQPNDVTPGLPRYYATSMVLDGDAVGLLVRSNDGRPTKVEGNPEHPASLGAAGIYEQASVLQLYDPHRLQAARQKEAGDTTLEAVAAALAAPRADRGAGLRVLMQPQSSQLVAGQLAAIAARYPEARFTFWSPISRGAREALRTAFGRPLQIVNDLSGVDTVLSLDADFLTEGPLTLRYARQFTARRRVSDAAGSMARLYVVESMPTPTGTVADHRLARRAVDVPAVAAAIAAEILPRAGANAAVMPQSWISAIGSARGKQDPQFVQAVAADLLASRGRALVIAGERQPAEVHALAWLMNLSLGAVNRLAAAIPSTLTQVGGAEQSLPDLVSDMRNGLADTLLILEGNPVYDAPADLDFRGALAKVPNSFHVSLYANETASVCTWMVPALHYLESWGDARSYDGTVSFIQPLIAPLYGGFTTAGALALLAGDPRPNDYRLMRDFWGRQPGFGAFQTAWDRTVQRGLIPGTQFAGLPVTVDFNGAAALADKIGRPAPGGMELSIRPDPKMYDGRFADNAWLLELPAPVSKLSWDNAAYMSPATAARLGVSDQDVVAFAVNGKTLKAPVLTQPGHAVDSVTMHLGWGRQGAEWNAAGVGVDVGPARTGGAPFVQLVADPHPTGDTHTLARGQLHFTMDGREIVIASDLADYRKAPERLIDDEHRPAWITDRSPDPKKRLPTLMPAVPYTGNQWAMAIDLTLCTGCSACVVACQAENNIAVVGKEGVLHRREMYWIRIDTYYQGDHAAPRSMLSQPMLCQHCEKAPCEYVCPVNATVHSPDGLNEMIYNRCVGTRFCSNNCPYKVRRFNWFNWEDHDTMNVGLVEAQRNPDVTVRQRGVMEKCSFCVQRIREVEIRANIEKREIRDGEVVVACQQTCPTGAITFGSIGKHPDGTDQDTRVRHLQEEARAYSVLGEQGTRPRVQYLAKIVNPHA